MRRPLAAARGDARRRFAARAASRSTRGSRSTFPAPHSYTGEDVLELHGHGGPAVLRLLLARCVELGARLARARRVHAARVPQRQARPRAGRKRRRPHRRGDGDRGARGGAQPLRRVLARDPRAGRRADRAADVHRGDARLSRRGHRVPARGRRARASSRAIARAARARCCARARTGRAAARRAHRRAGRRSPTSASRACSTGWPATRSRSSRRLPGTTRDAVAAQIEIARHPADDRRHRRAARRPTTRSRRSASSARGRRSSAPISRWCWSTRAAGGRHRRARTRAILAQLPAALPRDRRPQQDRPRRRSRRRSRRARADGAATRRARHVWLSAKTGDGRRRCCEREILAHRRRARGHGRGRVPRARAAPASRCATRRRISPRPRAHVAPAPPPLELFAEELREAQHGARGDHRRIHRGRSAGRDLLAVLHRQIAPVPARAREVQSIASSLHGASRS